MSEPLAVALETIIIVILVADAPRHFGVLCVTSRSIQASGKVEALTVKRLRSLSSEVTKLKGKLKSLQARMYK